MVYKLQTMILTGKAKDDFNKWKIECKRLSSIEVLEFRFLSNVVQNSMIIEWLDSVGIYINTIRSVDGSIYCRILLLDKAFYGINRNDAAKKAIIQANEIYNERNQYT